MHDGVKTTRRSSLRVVNLVGQEWTLGATNWRSSSGEVSNNNCDGRRSTDDLGQLITPSVHLRVQDDARETARRAGPSATADTRLPRRRIDTARIVCAAGSMKLSSVRLSVPPARLSVRPSHHSVGARSCDGFAAAGPAAGKYRSTAARPALSNKREQCHVVSWRGTLNSFC